MWLNCPPLLLEKELRLAQPGAIIGFGRDVEWVFGRLPTFELEHEDEHVQAALSSSRTRRCRSI